MSREKDNVITYIQPFQIDSDNLVVSSDLKKFSLEVDSIMRVDSIRHASVVGLASIDGSLELNNRLAKARAKAMRNWLEKTTSLSSSEISISSRGEDWGLFKILVVNDPEIPAREELLDIIDQNLGLQVKENKIRALDGGKTWEYLVLHIFPVMRCAEVTLDLNRRYLVPIPADEIRPEAEEVVAETMETVPEEQVTIMEETSVYIPEETDTWRRRMYIKTDLPYWLMTWSNLAVEVDLAHHWSLNIPVYLSMVNYFKKTIKFRTFSFQPGIRYWFKPDNTGVYLEAHYGMGSWNFAFGGKYRYQDHFRKTPSMGGGVAAGYRMPVSKNGRWAMEFGGGVGVYHLSYDKFYNRPNGKLISSHKKTVFFIDNVNVSISYSFPIEKKKGGDK